MGKYALTAGQRGEWAATWQLVKTCRRGCCVFPYPSDAFGSMVLPKYWRDPTAEELAAAGPVPA